MNTGEYAHLKEHALFIYYTNKNIYLTFECLIMAAVTELQETELEEDEKLTSKSAKTRASFSRTVNIKMII